MKTCMICESTENVIDLFGYFAHEEFAICKTCARLASTLANGDLLNFRRKVVNAKERQPKKHAALAAPEPDDSDEYCKQLAEESRINELEMWRGPRPDFKY